jgi:archaellum component FlaC
MTEIDAIKKTIEDLEGDIHELNSNIPQTRTNYDLVQKILGLLGDAKGQLQELELTKQQQTKSGFTR